MDELAHIETFVAVARLRSFTEAARDLGLPQPLVSRRVKALERSWGGALFERDARGAQLTALGELALPYARDLVHHAGHLHDALARARASVVHVVAVPEGCPATSLAAVITAGAERGTAVAVREGPPQVRAEGLESGRHAAALVRVGPRAAPVRVTTGLAGAAGVAGASGAPAGRALHLDALRPRRAAGAPALPPVIRLTAEDAPEPWAATLRRAAARAGLPEGGVRCVGSFAEAVATALAEGGFVCCDERAARRHGLVWAPFADCELHRGYELRVGAGSGLRRADLTWLAPLLTDAIGAGDRLSPAAGPRAGDARGDDRLAATG